MDNRITKQRLKNAFGYEIVIFLVMVFCTLFVFEFIYGFLAPRLTVGQHFKYYYDSGIYTGKSEEFEKEFEKDDTFSYDIIRFDGESIVKNTNILRHRLLIQEGDLLITDFTKDLSDKVKVKTYVDEFDIYSLDALYLDAIDYLSGFLKEEHLVSVDKKELVYDYNNLDEDKIEQNFATRMKKDNRFRWDKQKWKQGLASEKLRLQKLCGEVKDFERVLTIGKQRGIFYEYTKYEQQKNISVHEEDRQQYSRLYQKEVDAGRANLPYAIKAEKLTGGRVDASRYFKIATSEQGAKDVAIMIFNFKDYQKDLQFEAISAINTIITVCSDILS